MKTLIIKLGAAGDVVRTTTLLHILNSEVDWITSDTNSILLEKLPYIKRIIKYSNLDEYKYEKYDLVINLEDDYQSSIILKKIQYKNLFGAYINKEGNLDYTENSSLWFDLSLISKYGLKKANELKFNNNKTYQEIIFQGLGYKFSDQKYILPELKKKTDLKGDIAICPTAGKVWPSKNWAYYDELKNYLVGKGFLVNVLPERTSILEHISDINNHNYLICGDSLPMHLGIGLEKKVISFFTCTSPYEIYDYGVLTKIISSKLKEYFYTRDDIEDAKKTISFGIAIDVIKQVINMEKK